MIALLSPAKKLDYEGPKLIEEFTRPELMPQTEALMKKLKKLSARQIGKLMDLSANLSDLNYGRYQEWTPEFDESNARQAILAFKGDVYVGMKAENFSEKEFAFAQKHVRILSGLHGLLRPLDRIRPYRLEMGTKLKVTAKKDNLYKFWGSTIAENLNQGMEESGSMVLVDLASNEYFKAVDKKALKADRTVNVHFRDKKDGKYKPIFLWVKQARGMMTSFMVKHAITEVEHLKTFDGGGYLYNKDMSTENEWVFTRDLES